MNELAGAGWGKRLLKSFNKTDMRVCLYTIFCTGGVDFVGGFSYYTFLKKISQPQQSGEEGQVTKKLADLNLNEMGIKNGEEIHELLFMSGKVKVPQNWAAVMSYF